MVARYRFVSDRDNVNGFYTGCTFANQLGISTQVPNVIEIVSNNADVSNEEIWIGNRKFYVTKPIVEITKENLYVLQMLELLKSLECYMECSYEEAGQKFAEYISVHNITRKDVDLYISKYPLTVFKYYYELKLELILS